VEPIRWGVIGTGPVTSQFARALRKMEDAVPLAVISRSEETATRFAKKHGFAIPLALGPDVFRRADIDVFYIATPNVTHKDICLAAIAARKPFVCEKPMTASLLEARVVREAAETAGVFAMEGMWLRFNSVVSRLREELRAERIGEVLSADMHVGYREQPIEAPVRDAKARDALAVFGCYGISLAEYLFGAPAMVAASGRADAAGAALHSAITLRYPNFSFVINSSIVATLSNSLRIVGTRGALEIPSHVIEPARLSSTSFAGRSALGKIRDKFGVIVGAVADQFPGLQAARGSGFTNEIAAVNDCLRKGKTACDINPLSATLTEHAVMDAARASLPTTMWQPAS